MTLVYLAAAWVAGIALASASDLPWQLLPLLGLISILGLLLWRDEQYVRLGAVCLLTAVLGAGRFLVALPRFGTGSLATYNGEGWVTLEGIVVGEPDERDRHTKLRVQATRLTLPDGTACEVEGLALVLTERYPRRAYGDRLRISGVLEDPPLYESFSYREYLARRGIHSLMWGAHVDVLDQDRAKPMLAYLFAIKRRAQTVISEMLPEPEASLLTGILLGVEAGIPEEVISDFEATGTSHIIAISGFNITIVAGIFAGIAGRLFYRRRALLVAMAAVAVYTVMVGASAAVVRAALMGVLYLFGRYVGRQSYAPVTLAAAALVMTAWNPHMLWDRGFQLSFAATAGLLFYTEPLERLLAGILARITSAERAQSIVAALSEGLLVTVAAGITTMPIILCSFGRLSPLTLVSNVMILPAQPYVMLIGGLATLLGMVLEPLGRAVGWVAWLFLVYTTEVVRLTAKVPVAPLPLEAEGRMVWGYYAVLGVGTWWLTRPREKRRELWARLREWLATGRAAKLLIAASSVLLALGLLAWQDLPDGRLHVHVLDVGQGDAILVETPSGRQMLIDGGPSPSLLLSRLGRRMPFWDRSIDLVVLTHPDEDHITGLVGVLERYRVDAVIWREMGCDDAICERWEQLLTDRGTAVYSGEKGLEVRLDEGVRMEVLHPGTALLVSEGFNDNSLVTRLRYGELSLLLTGDIQARAEEALLAEAVDLRSTVLKVAHHGACGSSTERFLEAVNPEVAVISVGEENEFGHPCEEVVERLEIAVDGADRLFRTDRDGSVEVLSDGARLWMETERRE